MPDLTTDYLGLRLRNPLVAAASPLSQTVDGVCRLADAGLAAVVVYSFFEERLREGAAAPPHPPNVEQPTPADYLGLLERAAAAVDVPVIGSLNGVTPTGWARYARAMQDAGAAAIELNVFWMPGPQLSGPDVVQRHVDVLTAVKHAVTVPVAVKLSPHAIASGGVVLRLDAAGADGLVLFNRYLQPDIDPDTVTVVPTLELSAPAEGRLPRTWIALLRRRVRASLAATTGVDSSADVVKNLLAGADVVMTASALLRHGVEHTGTLLAGLTEWMTHRRYDSIGAVRGLLSVPADADPADHVRAGYVAVLEAARFSYSRW
jgi:dihydroorotate dehydrogenase (fumarate)